MNCANHTDVPAAAYCRTCGKALCEACKRDVKGVIYCEDCIAARVEGIPAAAQVAAPAPAPALGPSPGLAGVLAVFFPFGIGQVYNRQYSKGLAHMLIFALLIWALSTSGDTLGPFLGITLAFFIVYQIIDAVRSARAIQQGQPAPDPLGIGKLFATREGEAKWTMAGAPIGAIVLIGLGVLFLLHNVGIFGFFHIGRFWPLALIALGVWIFQQRRTECGCVRCRCAGLMGPAVLVTLGVLFQLATLDVRGFHSTWPLLLIVIGAVKVLQSSGSTTGHIDTGSGPEGPALTDGPQNPQNQGVPNA